MPHMFNNKLYYDIPFNLDEFCKLHALLSIYKIPHEIIITEPSKDISKEYYHCQIIYPSKTEQISDVVIFRGSYGVEKGLLEMMGLTNTDDVKGYMTAKEVFDIWHKDWKGRMTK